jgi:translation initiation factor IF-2
MKTITEFSGVLLQRAAQVPELPPEPTPPPEPEAVPAPEAAVEAEAGEQTAPVEGEGEAAAPVEGEAAAPVEGEASPGDEGETPERGRRGSGRPKAQVAPPRRFDVEAIGAAVGLSGDRLAQLVEALKIVGRRVGDVRRVRVVSLAEGERPPENARKEGEVYYLVDGLMQPERRGDRGRDERGRGRGDRGGRGRGGDDRGGPRGGRGGPGGGRGGPGGGRGGPGGGRGGPGGGRGGPGGGRGGPGGGGGPGSGGGRRPG